ncbi:hypothetical protein ABKN59_010601 [Abortiporus biennis]
MSIHVFHITAHLHVNDFDAAIHEEEGTNTSAERQVFPIGSSELHGVRHFSKLQAPSSILYIALELQDLDPLSTATPIYYQSSDKSLDGVQTAVFYTMASCYLARQRSFRTL